MVGLPLSGCATADLTGGFPESGVAELDLNLMASSQNSTTCVISAIDGQDVSDKQSFRLTTQYAIPSGEHRFTLLCEDAIGSIPVQAYRVTIDASIENNGEYVLVQRMRRSAPPCISIEDIKSKLAVAEYCPDSG